VFIGGKKSCPQYEGVCEERKSDSCHSGILKLYLLHSYKLQGGSNMTGTDVARFTHKSVPVIFEPPCIKIMINILRNWEFLQII